MRLIGLGIQKNVIYLINFLLIFQLLIYSNCNRNNPTVEQTQQYNHYVKQKSADLVVILALEGPVVDGVLAPKDNTPLLVRGCRVPSVQFFSRTPGSGRGFFFIRIYSPEPGWGFSAVLKTGSEPLLSSYSPDSFSPSCSTLPAMTVIISSGFKYL